MTNMGADRINADRIDRIVVWLPSPIGDAILSTPTLRAIRRHFTDAHICFVGNKAAIGLLCPGPFNDDQIEQDSFVKLVHRLKKGRFATAVLLKNSFGSAATVFAAGIKKRIGYARDGRDMFLTDGISPRRLPGGDFKPGSMIDYYLRIAKKMGCDTTDRRMELPISMEDNLSLSAKMPAITMPNSTIVILVPGGAFGPSKCWPVERFARTADWLVENYGVTVIVSVAPNKAEQQIAQQICNMAKSTLHNLTDTPLTTGELKSLFTEADLVITNDTGPRHIAMALGRKIITMFGPNDPQWTQTGYKDEIQLTGQANCAPCNEPICTQPQHLCMESITVEHVCRAAMKMLRKTEQ